MLQTGHQRNRWEVVANLRSKFSSKNFKQKENKINWMVIFRNKETDDISIECNFSTTLIVASWKILKVYHLAKRRTFYQTRGLKGPWIAHLRNRSNGQFTAHFQPRSTI
jgi:hypothetical protein